jgi:hypothetical protein
LVLGRERLSLHSRRKEAVSLAKSETTHYHYAPAESSLVSEKRKTASFAQMLFYAILATKLIVKVHVYPDDSGRY